VEVAVVITPQRLRLFPQPRQLLSALQLQVAQQQPMELLEAHQVSMSPPLMAAMVALLVNQVTTTLALVVQAVLVVAVVVLETFQQLLA
jgi:hypothetical protein